MGGLVLDLFAGAGGWAEGLRSLGIREVGIEIDRWACATKAAAGHATVRADVATYPPEAFAGCVEGLIASPPCADWSRAGRRAGLSGKTGGLVFEVMRWSEALRPLWIACEQVPDVLPIWQEFAWRLRQLGYATWAGLLNCADLGVPQTRIRAFLLAHRQRPALPPTPTHCWGGAPAGLFGPALLPWVTMADALGWDDVDRPARTVCGNRGPRWAYEAGETTGWTLRGEQPGGLRWKAEEPSLTVDSMAMQWTFVNGNRPHAARRGPHEPAPTIHFGHQSDVSWVATRPATTVAGTDRIGRPGHKDREDGEAQFAKESVRITIAEASVLQGFPPDYPWQGTKTKQFQQCGNCVPPQVAAAVVGALTGSEILLEVPA